MPDPQLMKGLIGRGPPHDFGISRTDPQDMRDLRSQIHDFGLSTPDPQIMKDFKRATWLSFLDCPGARHICEPHTGSRIMTKPEQSQIRPSGVSDFGISTPVPQSMVDLGTQCTQDNWMGKNGYTPDSSIDIYSWINCYHTRTG